jgi:hypothetical protein
MDDASMNHRRDGGRRRHTRGSLLLPTLALLMFILGGGAYLSSTGAIETLARWGGILLAGSAMVGLILYVLGRKRWWQARRYLVNVVAVASMVAAAGLQVLILLGPAKDQVAVLYLGRDWLIAAVCAAVAVSYWLRGPAPGAAGGTAARAVDETVVTNPLEEPTAADPPE